MIPVPNSSNVSHIGYDPETQRLHVMFRGGTVYHYKGVETEHWSNIQAAMQNEESVGKYLNQNIKNAYEFEKIPVDESAESR